MAITEINKTNFNQEVLEAKMPVIADFNAEWCGPCRMLKPILEEFAEANTNVKVVSINIDEEAELAESYSVASIPCLVVFKDGKEVKRNVGLISRDDLEELVKE